MVINSASFRKRHYQNTVTSNLIFKIDFEIYSNKVIRLVIMTVAKNLDNTNLGEPDIGAHGVK